jgi:transposase
LVLKNKRGEIHFPQEKTVTAKKIVESKRDGDLFTVAVDLNVKHLAVITVRQHGTIIETVFASDQGLEQHRYRHMKQIAKKQWQSGKAVKGERSNQQIWSHVKRMNDTVAHQVAAKLVSICEQYPGCVLLFERLRKMKPGAMSQSRRLNRKQANQLKGKIRDYAQDKAYAEGVVSCEVNAHGTSQYCCRCGARGERFSRSGQTCTVQRGGKLFRCPACGYEAQADFNASVNVHHSYMESAGAATGPKGPRFRWRGHAARNLLLNLFCCQRTENWRYEGRAVETSSVHRCSSTLAAVDTT